MFCASAEAADVEGFPSESEFAENCADKSKGMTREEPVSHELNKPCQEFLTYLRAESADYLAPRSINRS